MIKDVLDSLLPQQRGQLMHAFENEFAQYVELSQNRFIGVNVQSIRHLKIIESAGCWYYGTIKGRT